MELKLDRFSDQVAVIGEEIVITEFLYGILQQFGGKKEDWEAVAAVLLAAGFTQTDLITFDQKRITSEWLKLHPTCRVFHPDKLAELIRS